MKKLVYLIGFILMLGTMSAFAQADGKQTISQKFNGGDPFSIAPGSSFSASGSSAKFGSVDPDLPKPAVIADVNEALRIIRDNYVGGRNVDNRVLVKSAISGSLRSLDPHSSYFDPNEFRDLLQEQQSEYSGIGATIVNYQKNGSRDTYIISTMPGSPAALAHLRFGDKIVAVNGESVTGQNSADVRDMVRGRFGTNLRISIERAGSKRSFVVDLKRGLVPQPSVPDWYILRPGVGYIDMTEGFNYTTSAELAQALSDLHHEGLTSVIIDLRGNPGGILEQAVRVAEQFLPAGSVVVSQRGRFPIDTRVWKAAGRSPETMPLVILVDENTASASEIVAGALQDHDRALIIGAKTFGKGLVQNVINLPSGAGLTLTAARYFTPSGRLIQRDYSNGSIYEYFNNHADLPEAVRGKFEARTTTNRKVYGGDGISPDESVADPDLTNTQIALLDPIFFYCRDVLNASPKTLYKQADYGRRIKPSDLVVSDDEIAAFRRYVLADTAFQISPPQIDGDSSFIRTRIRYLMAMASFGNVSANQVLTENDVQVGRAIQALPRAQQLSVAADSLLRNKNSRAILKIRK